MTPEQKYIFDVRGYIVLKQVISPELIAACHTAMDRYEFIPEKDMPDPLCLGAPDTHNHRYVSNILEGSPEMRPLIDHPAVLDIVAGVSGDSYRLNHTYAMYNRKDYHTWLHMGGTPINDKCQYRCENGRMISTLSKAVIPLTDCGADDGAFAVIAGSHKSALKRPFGDHPLENPILEPVEVKAGDVIIFTEAMTHGSFINQSGKHRRTLYFCYSIGWMPEWHTQGLRFSPRINEGLTDQQKEVIAMKYPPR